jgi:hypothetical protein
MAAVSDFVDANLIEVESCGVAISYSKSSITGDPRFSYTDKDQNLNFAGSEIRVEETGIGELVSVPISNVPDLEVVTVSLLLPKINLSSTEPQSAFETQLIFTTHRTSIGGPSLVAGQLKTYKCLSVEGTAQRVSF